MCGDRQKIRQNRKLVKEELVLLLLHAISSRCQCHPFRVTERTSWMQWSLHSLGTKRVKLFVFFCCHVCVIIQKSWCSPKPYFWLLVKYNICIVFIFESGAGADVVNIWGHLQLHTMFQAIRDNKMPENLDIIYLPKHMIGKHSETITQKMLSMTKFHSCHLQELAFFKLHNIGRVGMIWPYFSSNRTFYWVAGAPEALCYISLQIWYFRVLDCWLVRTMNFEDISYQLSD